jgi:hypothetical protein
VGEGVDIVREDIPAEVERSKKGQKLIIWKSLFMTYQFTW